MSAALRERAIHFDGVTAGINSSTGGIGLQERPFRRAYLNVTSPIETTDELIAATRETTRFAGRQALRTDGRAVVRGLFDQSVITDLVNRGDRLHRGIEVAVPVGQDEWYTVWAENGPKRGQSFQVSEMVKATETYEKTPNSAKTNVEKVLNKGYRIVSEITPEMTDDVLLLWGKTFNWDNEEVKNLAESLQREKEKPPHERTMWFTGIMDGDQLIAANMAERVMIPSKNGDIKIVESTEWKVKETVVGPDYEIIEQGYEGKGLMQAAIAATNVQVLEDLGTESTFIYAECNFASRADIAGQRAGMVVPPRSFDLDGSGEVRVAEQVMIGNVGINDNISGVGYPMEEGGKQFELRDFVFLHLPQESIEQHYGFEDRSYVLSHLDGREGNNYAVDIYTGPQGSQPAMGIY